MRPAPLGCTRPFWRAVRRRLRRNPDDPASDPIIEANNRKDSGDRAGAYSSGEHGGSDVLLLPVERQVQPGPPQRASSSFWILLFRPRAASPATPCLGSLGDGRSDAALPSLRRRGGSLQSHLPEAWGGCRLPRGGRLAPVPVLSNLGQCATGMVAVTALAATSNPQLADSTGPSRIRIPLSLPSYDYKHLVIRVLPKNPVLPTEVIRHPAVGSSTRSTPTPRGRPPWWPAFGLLPAHWRGMRWDPPAPSIRWVPSPAAQGCAWMFPGPFPRHRFRSTSSTKRASSSVGWAGR